MTIASVDQLFSSSNGQIFFVTKNAPGASTGIDLISYWNIGTIPVAGAIPTATATVLSSSSQGAIPVPPPTTPPVYNYIRSVEAFTGSGGTNRFSMEIHDRLMHAGGLSGTVTTTQTITGMDIVTQLGVNNLSERIGAADYSHILWLLEIFTGIGATASTLSISVTYTDSSSGTITLTNTNITSGGSVVVLNRLIPAVDSGKFIRSINSLTLSASTTITGNIGFVATVPLTSFSTLISRKRSLAEWRDLGLPRIPNQACLCLFGNPNGSTEGAPNYLRIRTATG